MLAQVAEVLAEASNRTFAAGFDGASGGERGDRPEIFPKEGEQVAHPI